jgi:SAM-dependent methyltransferase
MSEPESDAAGVNRAWFVHYVLGHGGTGLRVLDFGCGFGEVVALLRDRGVDASGADVFYDGADWSDARLQDFLRQGTIRRIGEDGRLPFADDSFDLVISDQVLEHVERLEEAVAEIDRVLTPRGISYHHFPTLDALREGHTGIPLAHRLPRGWMRYAWTYALRRAGLGKHTTGHPDPAAWTCWKLDWIDRYCFYRSNAEIRRLVADEHVVVHREVDYCRFRADGRPGLRTLLRVRPLEPLYRRVFQRLGFTAIELHPRA